MIRTKNHVTPLALILCTMVKYLCVFLTDDNDNKLFVEELLWVGHCVKYSTHIISFNPDINQMIIFLSTYKTENQKRKLRVRDIMTQGHTVIELEKCFAGMLCLTSKADILNYYNAYLNRINILQNNQGLEGYSK